MRMTATLLLAGFYLVMVPAPGPLDAVVGVIAASAIVFATTRHRRPRWPLRRLIALPRFLLATAVAMTRGAATTWWRFARRRTAAARVVEVPIGDRSPRGAVVSGLVATLTPGTVLVRIDADRRVMVIHTLAGDSAAAVGDDLDRFYRRYQRSVFP